MRTQSLFDGERLTMDESIALTTETLRKYRERYNHWSIAYSGGKDSSALVTLTIDLIERGEVRKPESLTVLYADTRMELPPLQASAMRILDALRDRGYQTRVVMPALDDRFYVYMFGRGVPPPKNRFRWCTPQLKIEPMEESSADLHEQIGEKLLMLTGVRLGESAQRDQRIVTSCSRDGAECGQGWIHLSPDKKIENNINQYFIPSGPNGISDTLAPILHWRVCHVWDWLMFYAPDLGFPTTEIAEAYGGDEALEINARTGCVGCPLASQDFALDAILRIPRWKYLAPLKRLRPLYEELNKFHNRLRKYMETNADGSLAANQGRRGPLTMDAREMGLKEVLSIQREVNKAARAQGMPEISLINKEEYARIRELIEANTWPNKWTGEEERGDTMKPEIYKDGSMQPLIFGE